MNYVVRGNQKTAVKTRQDAIALMQALNENGCTDAISRQEVIGKEGVSAFEVAFDLGEDEISVCSQDDAETILHWLLDLGVRSVTIKRVNA